MDAKESFQDVLEDRQGKCLLVKFGATWCAPCRAIQPHLETLAEQWIRYIDVYSLDVDDDPDVAVQYNIRSVPTLIFFDDEGDILGRIQGNQSMASLTAFIEGFFE